MPNAILVRGARQLLTLRGPGGPRRGSELRNLGIVQDGAVLVVDGVIREVGPTRRIENLALARKAGEIDASGCVVMPGFVDCYTHLVSGPARLPDYEQRLSGANSQETAQPGGGTPASARSIQELSSRALQTIALRALEDAVRHGTTALEARSASGLTEAALMKTLRVQSALPRSVTVISTLLCAHEAPSYENRIGEYLDWMCSHLLPLLKRRKLVEFAAIRCEPRGITAAQADRYLRTARQLEFALRVDAGPALDGGAISLATDLRAASVDGVVQLDEQDIGRLVQCEIIATLLPGPAFFLGTGRFPPARRLIDAGAAVALASGYNPETSPSQNMQMMMSLACTSMRMTPAEAITAATINAAHAVRRASRLGSLESGKRADLLILSVPDYREIPYHFGVNLVDLVMTGGEILVRRSEVRWPAN